MKKLFILVSCFAMVLILSKVSFAQPDEDAPGYAQSQLSVEKIVAEADAPTAHQVLPFGYPPYPTVDGYPAYGIPYSYPRAQRRLGSRLGSPRSFKPYALPAPGAVLASPAAPTAVPPMVMGQVPPMQETLGAVPTPGQPTVFYRPTPIKNFMTLMASPRPYIGYDPYAGYPPFPGYAPPQ
jgi:hypothetical protein